MASLHRLLSHCYQGFLAFTFLIGLVALILTLSRPAGAGVFNTTKFVKPGDFSMGTEVELTLNNGAGLGANLKGTYGFNDLLNFAGIIGTGSGPRKFRIGGQAVFDLFPDIEGQPGLGVAGQALYYRLKEYGQLDLTAIPYINKTFISEQNEYTPFVAVPFGIGINSAEEAGSPLMLTVAAGALFKRSEHFSFSAEIGISVKDAYTYFAGGLIYSL